MISLLSSDFSRLLHHLLNMQILQWMAASQAGRDVLFYSFGQEDVTEPLIDLVKTLADREITVGRLWEALAAWDRNSQSNLFKYLNAVL